MFDPFKYLRAPVPAYLRDMLAIEKKAELEAFCRAAEVSSHDFSLLIFNSESLGYLHEIHHHEFRPAHLEPNDAEVASWTRASPEQDRSSNRQRFIRKVSQILKERRLFVAHTFFNENRWHAFYFDQRDRLPGPGNHWKEGSHLHFINDLWPEYNLESFWGSLNEANPKIGGALHIRFKPAEKPRSVSFP